MSNADWYARKLGQMGVVSTPASAPQREGAALPPPAQAYRPPVALPAEHMLGQVEEEEEDDPRDADGKLDVKAKLRQVVSKLPAKALGARQETQSCPGCGGNNFFSQTQGVTRGPAPAPSCFDCGYPLVQAGSGMGSLSGMAATGAAQQAPQAARTGPAMNTIIAHI